MYCKTNPAEYECSDCTGFKRTCESCCKFYHLVPDRKNHNRHKIMQASGSAADAQISILTSKVAAQDAKIKDLEEKLKNAQEIVACFASMSAENRMVGEEYGRGANILEKILRIEKRIKLADSIKDAKLKATSRGVDCRNLLNCRNFVKDWYFYADAPDFIEIIKFHLWN